MRVVIFTLAISTIVISAKSVHKRNAYGDELIVPSETVVVDAPSGSYAEEAPVVVPDAGYGQPLAAAVVPEVQVEESGYRSKRNAYGDELVVPDAVVEENVVVPSYEEAAPVIAPAPAAAIAVDPYGGAAMVHQLPVVHSGYRARRNAYGDEQVVPTAEGAVPSQGDNASPAIVEQEVAAVAPPTEAVDAAVETSGYRAKRNIYGDELILPSALQHVAVPMLTEVDTVAIDQGHYAAMPYVVHSGYRSRARVARRHHQ